MSNRRRITSIKPGRAPSFLGGIGSAFAVIFGIFWTAMTFSITRHSPFGGVSIIFPLFGILFIIMGVVNAVYNFRQATQKNRYSVLDITDSETEPDPLNERFGPIIEGHVFETHQGDVEFEAHDDGTRDNRRPRFCPYCGDDLGEDFRFCPSCGKRLPE